MKEGYKAKNTANTKRGGGRFSEAFVFFIMESLVIPQSPLRIPQSKMSPCLLFFGSVFDTPHSAIRNPQCPIISSSRDDNPQKVVE
jgi:hypothetical protein